MIVLSDSKSVVSSIFFFFFLNSLGVFFHITNAKLSFLTYVAWVLALMDLWVSNLSCVPQFIGDGQMQYVILQKSVP
jgi:hypothetical protein